MQVELNAILLNLNSIKISKIEFKYIESNLNFIELNKKNQIKHNIHFLWIQQD
jgi:hypothetical protein